MSLLTLKEACGSASRSSRSYVYHIPKRGRQFDYICGILPVIILFSCHSILSSSYIAALYRNIYAHMHAFFVHKHTLAFSKYIRMDIS
jgi:hypothetical protein